MKVLAPGGRASDRICLALLSQMQRTRVGSQDEWDVVSKINDTEVKVGVFEPPFGWRIDVLAGQQVVTGRGGFVVAVLHLGSVSFFALQLDGGTEVSCAAVPRGRDTRH